MACFCWNDHSFTSNSPPECLATVGQGGCSGQLYKRRLYFGQLRLFRVHAILRGETHCAFKKNHAGRPIAQSSRSVSVTLASTQPGARGAHHWDRYRGGGVRIQGPGPANPWGRVAPGCFHRPEHETGSLPLPFFSGQQSYNTPTPPQEKPPAQMLRTRRQVDRMGPEPKPPISHTRAMADAAGRTPALGPQQCPNGSPKQKTADHGLPPTAATRSTIHRCPLAVKTDTDRSSDYKCTTPGSVRFLPITWSPRSGPAPVLQPRLACTRPSLQSQFRSCATGH